eukprot:7007261-Pyramimonas_sp.AAC.1
MNETVATAKSKDNSKAAQTDKGITQQLATRTLSDGLCREGRPILSQLISLPPAGRRRAYPRHRTYRPT